MLLQGIKSRPIYKGIAFDENARRHVFALAGEGALALVEQVKYPGQGEICKADILYVATGSKHLGDVKKLADLKANDLWVAPTLPVLLYRLTVVMAAARMGMRLYISGTEGYIGQAMQGALNHGVDFNSIRTEHRGSEARRVQCVHCKGITDNVKTNIYVCMHCGLSLLVRDHYSRRIAAFQGVCIDAEEPGIVPPLEELFP